MFRTLFRGSRIQSYRNADVKMLASFFREIAEDFRSPGKICYQKVKKTLSKEIQKSEKNPECGKYAKRST